MARAKTGYMDQFLTPADSFFEVTRGRPHQLPPEARRQAGLTPETWRLEVVPAMGQPQMWPLPLS